MTKEQFQDFWKVHYPKVPPINHIFKHDLKDKWLRMHSLPEVKRYANTEEEWEILMHRQNTVLAEFMPLADFVYIVSGIYSNKEKVIDDAIFDSLSYFKSMKFTQLDALDMFTLSNDWFDEGVTYTPCFAKEMYKPNVFDNILKSIANDEWRLFFIIPINATIVAPYDGGIDIILKDEIDLNFYKNKYVDWLSERGDGL